MANELLTANEMAARLRIRPGTLRLWTRRGRVPVVRLSPKVLRYDAETVCAALVRRTAASEVQDAAQ